MDKVKKRRGQGLPSTQKHAYRYDDAPTKTDVTDVVRHADANTKDTNKAPRQTHGHTDKKYDMYIRRKKQKNTGPRTTK